jgi:hypothetical protein
MKKLSMKHSVRAAVFAVMGLSVAGVVMAAGPGSQNLTINLQVPVGAPISDFDATFIPGTQSTQHPVTGWSHGVFTLNAPTTAPGDPFTAGGNVAIYSQNNALSSVDMYLAGSSAPTATFGSDTIGLTVAASQQFALNPQAGFGTASETLPLTVGSGNYFQLPGNTSMAAATIAYDYLQVAGVVPPSATQQGSGTFTVTVTGNW